MLNFFRKLFQSSDRPKPEKRKKRSKRSGLIRYFNHSRGYGFIRSKQLVKDVFVHISDMPGRGRTGVNVLFDVEQNEKGLRAKNVEFVVEDH